MFGILMKVRLSHIGGVISPVEKEVMSVQTDSNGKKSPSERVQRNLRASQSYGQLCLTLLLSPNVSHNTPFSFLSFTLTLTSDARCCTAAGPVSFIFSGTALVVPYGAPLNPLMQKLQQAHTVAAPKSSHSPKVCFMCVNFLFFKYVKLFKTSPYCNDYCFLLCLFIVNSILKACILLFSNFPLQAYRTNTASSLLSLNTFAAG